jgi:hypothetical protein
VIYRPGTRFVCELPSGVNVTGVVEHNGRLIMATNEGAYFYDKDDEQLRKIVIPAETDLTPE